MTTIIASASAQNTAAFSSPVTVIRPAGAAEATETPASTVVSLRQGNRDIGASTYTQSGAVTDAISTLMTRNVGTRVSAAASPFADVGAAVLNRFRTDGGNLSLWTPATVSAPTAESSEAELGETSQSTLRADNAVSLQIATASGVKVQISLERGAQGMAVQVDVSEGELNEDERRAIANLASSFQDALDGLAEEPPRWSLAKLANASSPLLSSISLRHTRMEGGDAVQTIDFQADSSQRTLTVSGLTGVVKVSVDVSKPITLGSQEQQAAAISKHLQQFDRAQRRGAGDEALMASFKDMFSAMHSSVGATQVPAAGTTWRQPATDAHRSMLSGLADFSASIEQVREASNPAQPKELDGFSFHTSQSSSVSGQARWDLAVSQTQETALTASYHRGLTPQAKLEMSTDKESQTYRYFQIHDTTRSQTDVAYQEGVLATASLNESSTQTTQVTTYIKGKLTDQTVTPASTSNQRNLLPLLRAAKLDVDPEDTSTPRDQAEAVLRAKYLELARSVANLRQN